MDMAVGQLLESEMGCENLIGRIRKLHWLGLEEDAMGLKARLCDAGGYYVVLDEPMATD